jgi:hypothetical protein
VTWAAALFGCRWAGLFSFSWSTKLMYTEGGAPRIWEPRAATLVALSLESALCADGGAQRWGVAAALSGGLASAMTTTSYVELGLGVYGAFVVGGDRGGHGGDSGNDGRRRRHLGRGRGRKGGEEGKKEEWKRRQRMGTGSRAIAEA